MNQIAALQSTLKKKYDRDQSPLNDIKALSVLCLDRLKSETSTIDYGITGGKQYTCLEAGRYKSRPLRQDLLILDSADFSVKWDYFISSMDPKTRRSNAQTDIINSVLYTSVISFAACYDIWKNTSRKTPGTHFEVILGSVLSQLLPDFYRTKFISLPGADEKVSTDIVFEKTVRGVTVGLVIPAKITTRERVVQPYAHQRILDSAYQTGRFKSILMCVSETQRDDKKTTVNEICVPGTIKLFEQHLSSLSGIYYIDPPERYLQPDITSLVPVADYGHFFKNGLSALVSS